MRGVDDHLSTIAGDERPRRPSLLFLHTDIYRRSARAGANACAGADHRERTAGQLRVRTLVTKKGAGVLAHIVSRNWLAKICRRMRCERSFRGLWTGIRCKRLAHVRLG